MEKEIKITISDSNYENAKRLVYAIERHVGWDSRVIYHLSKLLSYNEDQLAKDLQALVSIMDNIEEIRDSELTGDVALLEGWC